MRHKSYTYHERSRLITPDDPSEVPRQASGWVLLWVGVIAIVVMGIIALLEPGPIRVGFAPPQHYVDPAAISR